MKLSLKIVLITGLLLITAALALACSGAAAAVKGNSSVATSAVPGLFKVENLAVNPAEVNAGVDALIVARVTNTGSTSQQYEGQVRLDNASEAALPTFLSCQRVNIPAGSTQTVSVAANINNPGKYKVTLEGVTQDFIVNPPDPNAPSSFSAAGGVPVAASDFTAVDVVTGKPISFQQYNGTAVLLNFVNYGCDPSVNNVVSAQLLALKKLKDQRSDFVPVSVFCGCCPPDVLKQFAKDNDLNWPWILDSDNSIVAKYSKYVTRFGYPTLVFINADHQIIESTRAVSPTILNDKVNSLVSGVAIKTN